MFQLAPAANTLHIFPNMFQLLSHLSYFAFYTYIKFKWIFSQIDLSWTKIENSNIIVYLTIFTIKPSTTVLLSALVGTRKIVNYIIHKIWFSMW